MITTIGIDIGTSAVKSVLFRTIDGKPEWLEKRVDRLRKRDPMKLATEAYQSLLADAGLHENEIDYVATTGDGENVEFRTGHFYSMTTHARGAVFLEPEARAVIDIGALHGRAISTDERGKVLSYKMTSQCASGSGQFLENIARYLGVSQDEVGSLSKAADDPETVSSICAVLAETDVINMVSRGISTQNILKGIHLSMAGRLVKLLKSIKAKESSVFVSGGLAQDEGLLAAIREQAVEQKLSVKVSSNSDSIYA
ncbi:MAG: benzoyl-CoA reductase subunit D, partial [Deltaproteobacteria bacterium]|nr:benzoyl-CoA reductase subunit D [Deltaproteobacteria bacterium]